LRLHTSSDNAMLARLVPALQSLDVYGTHAVTSVLRVLLHYALGISLLEARDDDDSTVAGTVATPAAAARKGRGGAAAEDSGVAVGALSSPSGGSGGGGGALPLHTVGPTPAFALPGVGAPAASAGGGRDGGESTGTAPGGVEPEGLAATLQACTTLISGLVDNILEVLAALQLASEGEVRPRTPVFAETALVLLFLLLLLSRSLLLLLLFMLFRLIPRLPSPHDPHHASTPCPPPFF
jgi:hypothetical protein